MSDTPLWERRFRATRVTLPAWSRTAPDRAVYETNASGTWQVHALDVASGSTRQVSDHPVGVTQGSPSRDGAEVVFWQEDTGDETGRWLAQPWEGGGNEPFLEGLPVGWNEGMAQGPGIVVAGISDDTGFAVHMSHDGQAPVEIARSGEWLALWGTTGIPGPDRSALSADGSLLAMQHAEHGELTHPSLRVVDPRTRAVVGDRGDGTSAVVVGAWSPVPGDQRLTVAVEPADRLTVAIWDLASDTWTPLEHRLTGDVVALDWWPDASALLLQHLLDGRHELFRFDLGSGTVTPLGLPAGAIDDARVRPDGSVWAAHTDGVHVVRVLDDRGAPVLPLADAPAGRPFHDWRYENDHGQTVHGWIVEPEGDGPHPIMVFVHGGPHWLYEDRYMPEVQAYADLGFLVAMPNYRGSTGYGRAWRDALTGDVGFTDVDDVTAGLRDLRRRTDVDPSRTVIAGWSWGGYITLMQLGRNPDLWTAGMAGVPVGDYVMAYADEAPALQAMDRALFGGTPDERPDEYRRGNPITYADDVAAPVMFVIGEHDSRCPLPQALAYVDRLASRGAPHEVYRFSTGHGSNVVDEDVRQMRAIIDFLRANVPGLREI
jgi:dipeptidyl aminopeptidase/acylaminoacyl peptidase